MRKLFFIIFVVIVFAGLFLFRVSLVQQLSPSLAKYYGIDISRVEINQIDVDKIVIPMLAMQHKDGAIRSSIEIHNLVVDIDTYKAEVSAVSSSYVSIEVEDIGGADTKTNEQSMKDLVNLLPIFGISIERLEIKYRQHSEEVVRFDGELLYAQHAMLRGVLSSWDAIDLAIELSVDESGFVVNVSQIVDDEVVIALAGDYYIEDDWLDVGLNGDLSFSGINQFLQVFDVEIYIQEDVSTIKARLELDLLRSTRNIMRSFAAELDLDSTLTVTSKHLDVKQAQVDVSVSCRVKKSDTVNCSFKNPQRAVIDFYKTPDWLTDHFNNIESEYVIEVNPSDQLAAKLSYKEILSANVEGDASISVRAQSSRAKVDGRVSGLSFNGIAQDWQLDAEYELDLEALNVSAPIKVSRLLMNGLGKLSANEKQVNIDFDKSFVVNALNVDYEGYKTNKIQLKQLENTQFIYRYQDNNINADDLKLALLFKRLRNNDIEFESAPIQVHINKIEYSSEKQKLIAKIDVDNILFKERGIPVSAHAFSADIDLKDNQLSIDSQLELGKQRHPVKLSATHDLLVGSGVGAMSGDAIELANNEIISHRISDSGYPLQLKGGTLDLNVDANWNVNNDESAITVKLLVDQVTGDYAQNQFSDFNMALEFIGQDGWKLKQAASIEIGMVNVGVPLKDVSMRLDRMEYGVQEQPLIKLSDLSASVLEGRIYSEQVELDLNRRVNMFSIFLSSLSLEKLIALNQTEDLVASGTLDGELPMRLDNGVLFIDGGWLRADESGGYIKYGRIGEVLVDNKNLQLVGELLEDFQYNEMSAKVDLLSGGELTLATKLHGRSPNAELNKQVNLNFNIDFNLWKFLESARLLTRIDQDISEQILSNQKR